MLKAMLLVLVVLAACTAFPRLPELVFVEAIPIDVPFYMTLDGEEFFLCPVCLGEGCLPPPVFHYI